MEAIGSLAGGIAHDFNNLLSVILSYTEFALGALPPDTSLRSDLTEVHKAGERAATLTRQLLAFSRKQVLQPVPLDLNHSASDLETMLRRILGEHIEYTHVLAPDLGVTVADPGQIEQVLMNLVINARDAMPNGGKLTIETRNVDLDDTYAARHVSVTPGQYVQLSVSDTGFGMSEETRGRVFEPFFTTKEQGKGTGLGLSTVYGIVKQSGGNIWVYSELGRGTTFKIYLPRAFGLEAQATSRPATPDIQPGRGETILVVEDEPALRSVVVRTLEEAGYTVLQADGGEAALDVNKRHDGPLDLLVTDVVMPRMGGGTLAQSLRTSRPGLEVLYMSGYTDNTIVHHGVNEPGTGFLGKPFSAAQLTQKVREVLDHESARQPVDDTDAAFESEPRERRDIGDTEHSIESSTLLGFSPELTERLHAAALAARYYDMMEIVEVIPRGGTRGGGRPQAHGGDLPVRAHPRRAPPTLRSRSPASEMLSRIRPVAVRPS